jgi:hypothetical protein
VVEETYCTKVSIDTFASVSAMLSSRDARETARVNDLDAIASIRERESNDAL